MAANDTPLKKVQNTMRIIDVISDKYSIFESKDTIHINEDLFEFGFLPLFLHLI